MNSKDKPMVWWAIFCVIPSAITFFAIRVLLAFLLSLLGIFLSKIPLIGSILGLFLGANGNSVFSLATILSLYFAFVMTTLVQNKLLPDESTFSLSRIIFGCCLALVHIYSLIVNAINGDNYVINIFCIITAFIFIFNREMWE